MPWVQEELRHDHFLDDFWNVVLRRYEDAAGNKWWANYSEDLEKIDAFKISYEPGLLTSNCDGDFIPNHKFPNAKEGGFIALTRHMIVKRWDGQLLGLAQSTGAVRFYPKKYSLDPVTFLEEMKQFFYETVDYTTLYTYMLEKYEHPTHFVGGEGGEPQPITYIMESQFNGVLASSLDIEFHNENMYGKEMYQSPVMTLDLVQGQNFSVGAIGKLNFKTDTNWWNDSKILLQGNIDTNSFCFILRADNAPIWHDGKVPQTPFYFGDVIDKGTGEFVPVAMFGGKAVDRNFDFDNTEVITNEAIMPTTRNYVHYPSNGVDSVMLKRTKFGARYQAHYLQWEVPPNEIPPNRSRIELNRDALEYAEKHKFFEDKVVIPFNKDETVIKFEPFGIAEPTTVLDNATHVVVGSSEIMELVSYDDKNWEMTVKRISDRPINHDKGEVIWGISAKMLEMFKTKRPRSWNNLTNDPNYYKYTPHPSRYSGKVHTSRLYLVHPEEGVVGELPNMVVATSINIYDGTRLTFSKPCAGDDCEEYTPPEKPETKGPLDWKPIPNSQVADPDDEYTPEPETPTEPEAPTEPEVPTEEGTV